MYIYMYMYVCAHTTLNSEEQSDATNEFVMFSPSTQCSIHRSHIYICTYTYTYVHARCAMCPTFRRNTNMHDDDDGAVLVDGARRR